MFSAITATNDLRALMAEAGSYAAPVAIGALPAQPKCGEVD